MKYKIGDKVLVAGPSRPRKKLLETFGITTDTLKKLSRGGTVYTVKSTDTYQGVAYARVVTPSGSTTWNIPIEWLAPEYEGIPLDDLIARAYKELP